MRPRAALTRALCDPGRRPRPTHETMAEEEDTPAAGGVAAAAAVAEPAAEAAGGAAPAGSHSLLNHLFQRVNLNKNKVIHGFAHAMCDVIATNYLTSGEYPTKDNYFAAIRMRIVESLLDYPSAAELATAKAALQAAATRSGWKHDDCCFAENATAVQGRGARM